MQYMNADRPRQWKADIAQSVDFYNQWFLEFAPKAYRDTRIETIEQVSDTLRQTENLTNITAQLLEKSPEVLNTLRMVTAPPIARDRLVGLAGVTKSLVQSMELKQQIPPRMPKARLRTQLQSIADMIMRLADVDVFPWLKTCEDADPAELHRAATVVADRLCNALTNPIIRNAQEQRQLAAISAWLDRRGYHEADPATIESFRDLRPGSYSLG